MRGTKGICRGTIVILFSFRSGRRSVALTDEIRARADIHTWHARNMHYTQTVFFTPVRRGMHTGREEAPAGAMHTGKRGGGGRGGECIRRRGVAAAGGICTGKREGGGGGACIRGREEEEHTYELQ